MYDFYQGFSVCSSGESGGLGSIRVWNQELTPRPNLFLAGFRQWSLHGLWKSWLAHPSQFWSKKTVHSFPTDRPPPQVNHQNGFQLFGSLTLLSLSNLKSKPSRSENLMMHVTVVTVSIILFILYMKNTVSQQLSES